MRLDSYIFTHHLAISRNKAKELIKDEKVTVNEKIIKKASFEIGENDIVKVLDDNQYVSRAAYKLSFFLKEEFVNIKDKVCLDIGSSTGGFIQVLLEHGAKEVYGVDVGTNQLHSTLLVDDRVRSYEETDIRDFFVDVNFDIVTCDVSFVGISYIMPSINRLATNDIILLFKPQFEVGKSVKRDRRGVVKDEKAIIQALRNFEVEAIKLGWQLLKRSDSKLRGKEGNIEVFYHFKKS
jgi:23S rRNA (cytidine1920-2'-O)/16S rRNA (cytidine1409-2'-O)-methyltransferase